MKLNKEQLDRKLELHEQWQDDNSKGQRFVVEEDLDLIGDFDTIRFPAGSTVGEVSYYGKVDTVYYYGKVDKVYYGTSSTVCDVFYHGKVDKVCYGYGSTVGEIVYGYDSTVNEVFYNGTVSDVYCYGKVDKVYYAESSTVGEVYYAGGSTVGEVIDRRVKPKTKLEVILDTIEKNFSELKLLIKEEK